MKPQCFWFLVASPFLGLVLGYKFLVFKKLMLHPDFSTPRFGVHVNSYWIPFESPASNSDDCFFPGLAVAMSSQYPSYVPTCNPNHCPMSLGVSNLDIWILIEDPTPGWEGPLSAPKNHPSSSLSRRYGSKPCWVHLTDLNPWDVGSKTRDFPCLSKKNGSLNDFPWLSTAENQGASREPSPRVPVGGFFDLFWGAPKVVTIPASLGI